MVPVTPAPPPSLFATRSAALLEPRAMIIRLSFSTEIALAEGRLNRPGVRHIHRLHSATELLLFALAEPSIFPSLTQRRDRTVASVADKATKSRQHCNPSRANAQAGSELAGSELGFPQARRRADLSGVFRIFDRSLLVVAADAPGPIEEGVRAWGRRGP
jgi:hypothetical protein